MGIQNFPAALQPIIQQGFSSASFNRHCAHGSVIARWQIARKFLLELVRP
jgi:hypothetical protein